MSFLQRVTNVSFQRTATAAADLAAAAPIASAAPVTATPSTVFVELGTASQQANISRDGVAVPIVDLNPAALQTALGTTTPVLAKVVSQSIQAGISVAKGTTIDLVLAEPSSLHVSVLQNPFQPLATETLDNVYKNIVRDNPQVQSVLARNSSSTALSTTDQATLTSALSSAGAALGTEPGQTMDAAFSTLQAAFAFGT
jgi:hypothetical protein